MDLPKLKLPDINFKAILPKLKVLTNNISVLVAVIITALSILLFIPTYFFSNGLKNQVQQNSINQGLNKINELFKVFNSPEQWKFDEKQKDLLIKDVCDVQALAQQTTQRQFLSKEVFSVDPNNSTFSSMIFTQFGRLYCSGIDSLIAACKSGVCVTKDEVDSTIKSTISDSSRMGSTSLTQSNLSRRPTSGTSVLSSYTSDLEWMVIDQLCQQRAKSVLCYIDPMTLGGYKELKNYEYKDIEKAESDCWLYQLAYWVIEDVVKTIDKMNSRSESVLVAPVKRLMEISFNTGIQRKDLTNFSRTDYRDTSVRVASATENKPVYVVLPADKLTDAYTAKSCNDMIDVIHFRVKFVMSTQALFELMRELCSSKSHVFIDASEKEQQFKHNQITVLETSLKPVDTLSANHELYRYGQGSVSELDMVCEYVFIKKGYEDTKPEIVKLALGMKINQAGTTKQ